MSFTKGAARLVALTLCKALSGKAGATAEAETMRRTHVTLFSARQRRIPRGARCAVPAVAPAPARA